MGRSPTLDTFTIIDTRNYALGGMLMIKVFFSTLNKFNLKYARFAVLYIILAAAAATAEVLSAIATGSMTQAAELGMSSEMVSFLVILAVSSIVKAAIDGTAALLRQRSYGKAIHTIRGTFAYKILSMPYKEFAAKNSGEGVALFINDAEQAATFITTKTLSQISQIITLLVAAAFMIYINWWLALVYLALFPLLTILQSKMSAPITEKAIEASKQKAENTAVVADALQNPLIVKAYGLEASVERRFDASYTKLYKATYEAAKIRVQLMLAGIFATITPTFALGIAACVVAINGGMTIAEFITLIVISSPVGNWLIMFTQELVGLRQSSASATRVMDYIQWSEIGNIKFYKSAGYAVSFDNVDFGYSDEAKILDDATFFVEKGSITAISGKSGCGKSTALKLMLGLYTPDSGIVSLASESITYVPQDCYLLPVSIRENIIGDLPYDEENLRAACENAGIYDFISSMPEGFDSVLDESAANVSGGQKQRIAMARAFYRDADVLLFDEATSSLDPATEQAVLDAFRSYVKSNGKTAVVVAHRQSVLDMSDSVITLSSNGGGNSEEDK